MVYSSTVHDFAPGLMSALFYGVVSGSMSFMNKVILTSYKFNYPDVVMLAQIVTTSIILEIARKCGWCSIPKWTFDRGREFMIPSCCFALHTTMALYALEDLSIPIYNVLRRMLPLATLLMSYFVLHKVPSKGLAMSVGLIVAGSLFAGLSDIAVHLVGYINALSSVAAQATYLTYVERTGIEKSSSAIGILHLNSINCIPLMATFAICNGHLYSAFQFKGFGEGLPMISFIVNILLGCVLNYSLFLCATMNSALTTSLVGVIKGVVTTIIGFFTFGGVVLTVPTIGGVILNSFGGILYTYVKYSEKKTSAEHRTLNDNKAHNKVNGTLEHVIDLHDGNSPFHRHLSITSDSVVDVLQTK